MAHSLGSPPAATATTPMSTRSKNRTHFPSSLKVSNDQGHFLDNKLVHRRAVSLGLAGAVLSLIHVGDPSANAAARRPPPPPVDENKEKKDPNVSGVLAKVLASKKRKEAMKQAVAKLREKGKPVPDRIE